MKDLEEQCVCVKFCFKLAKNFKENFQMLQQAYGEDCWLWLFILFIQSSYMGP